MDIPPRFRKANFCGALGFIGPGKNIHETIKAWASGVNRGLIDANRWGFIVVGDIDEGVFFYKRELEDYTRDCGYAENIFIVPKFIPREEIRHVMAAFDFVVLNTCSNTLSASGQVHALAAHGVPFCAAERPIYRDAINAGAIPFALGAENSHTIMTINAIAALSSSREMRLEIKKSIKKYAKETGWPIQARRHIEIYKELLS